jgi:hypothetical protein
MRNFAAPAAPSRFAGIAAEIEVELMNVVERSNPFQTSVEAELKFEPVIASRKAGAPTTAALGFKLVIDGSGITSPVT